MPGIQKFVTGDQPPVGVNNFLHSTKHVLDDSRTIAKENFPVEPGLDGNQKYLQKGEVLAAITSGPQAGKFGVFQLDATDGRGEPANIVGLNKTYYPYQLMDRNVDVANVYACVAKQAWCTIRNAAGARIPLTNALADAMRGRKDLQINFK